MENVLRTPENTLAADLRAVFDKENILTRKTKQKVVRALDEHISSNEEKKLSSKRNKAIEEIYASEISYVKQLEKLITYFKQPLEKLNIASSVVVNSLFGNIDTIYNINKELLTQLKQSRNNIPSAFIDIAPFLKVYSIYAYNYKQVINILENLPKCNPNLYNFISNQETRPEVKIKLNALLITPIQRIPRYLLLLKELDACTPKDFPKYDELQKAITEIRKVAEHINNLVEEQENTCKLLDIQKRLYNYNNLITPGRKLVKEGTLFKVVKDKKECRKRYVILLSDVLLYCKEQRHVNVLKCLKVLPLHKCSINTMLHKDDMFSIHCQSVTILLSLPDEAQVIKDWITVIRQTIQERITNMSSLSIRSSFRGSLLRKKENLGKRKRAIEHDGKEIEGCFHSPWKARKLNGESVKENEPVETIELASSRIKFGKQMLTSVNVAFRKYF